jgi:hypothetical protein
MTDLKLPMCRLYERRSKSSGLTYLSGKLGDLRILCFRESDVPEDQLYNSDARWQVFVTSSDQGYQQRVNGRERPALAAVASPAKWRDK